MTISSGPAYEAPHPEAGRPRRRVPLRFWFLGFFLAFILIIEATGGTRNWWAHRLHDLTGGSWAGDYVIGLVVGLLPVIALALGAIRSRGRRRVLRMLGFGTAGFVGTYLLSPSLSKYLTDRASAHVFGTFAPGYLAGVFTGAGLWLVAFVVVVLRARAWWRRVTRRGPRGTVRDDDRSPAPRVIDI